MSAWVLPDHIADVLPSEARHIEELRRQLLDTARGYGYELVMPPLLEHLESLLSGTGEALDLQTFKLVDQLSGRSMGLRAETTPQVAHIDAHLLDIPEQHNAAKGLAALSLYAEASAIDAPGFAVADGTLDAEAELNGLPDSLITFFGPELLRHIQQAGGKLNIVGLRGADETTSFELTGNLGLDAEMRTDGQLHLVSNGLVERLNGLIPAQMQPLIVGQPAEDGSYSQTLTFKSGVIFSGLVPVGMVPPLM